jgi:hypothetical protein
LNQKRKKMKKEDKRVTLHWMGMGNKLFVDTVVDIQKFSVFLGMPLRYNILDDYIFTIIFSVSR